MMDAERPWYWSVLEIDAGSDERAVKRAYARQLKTTRPDDDPDAFQRLRAAYEYALEALRHRADAPAPAAAPAPLALDKVALAPPPPVVLQVQRADTLSADALAHAAWGDFLETHTLAPLASLAAAQADERLHGFDARDAFELLAARHAADDACPPDLRAALAAHFDWTGRGGPVLRRDPDLAATVLGRHAADIGWDSLVEQAASDPLLAYLTQDSVPKKLPRRWDGHFVRTMRDTLLNIRWRHPDLLAHRMNHDVFHWWEAQVAEKRYFRQTAGWSIAAGLGLFLLTMTVTQPPAGIDETLGAGLLFVLFQLIAVGAGAWLAVRPPQALYARALVVQIRWFGKPLLDARFDRAWQVGWMAPLAILAVLLLVPDPHPALLVAESLGMTVCAALAILASSPSMTKVRFALAFVAAILTVVFGGAIYPFSFVPDWTLLCFVLALFTVFLNPGTVLFRCVGLDRKRLSELRAGWLTACLVLAFCMHQSILPAWHEAALMLLFVSGILIGRYNAGLRFVWFALMGIRAFMSLAQPARNQTQFYLISATLVVAFFVTSHLFSQSDD